MLINFRPIPHNLKKNGNVMLKINVNKTTQFYFTGSVY